MNLSLYKATARMNGFMAIIIFAVMMMYLSVIIPMYDPKGNQALLDMLKTLPKELVRAMGMENLGLDFTGFVGSYYYGFIAVMFPMVYSIIAANRLVAKQVDQGSMAYLLSTPNTRQRVVITQAVFLITSLTGLFILVAAAGIGISEMLFKGSLNIGKFILLNLSAMLIFYAVSGIAFFFSCLFNDTKNSLTFGAGIPILFFVIDMLAKVGPDLDWLKYFTVFTLFKPSQIINGDTFAGTACAILALIAIMFYGAGILAFKKRDLPL